MENSTTMRAFTHQMSNNIQRRELNSRNQFEKTQTLLCVALQCYVFVFITMINKITNVRKKERKKEKIKG